MGPYIDGDETLAIRYIDMTRFGKKLESNICLEKTTNTVMCSFVTCIAMHKHIQWFIHLLTIHMNEIAGRTFLVTFKWTFTWYYTLNYILYLLHTAQSKCFCLLFSSSRIYHDIYFIQGDLELHSHSSSFSTEFFFCQAFSTF